MRSPVIIGAVAALALGVATLIVILGSAVAEPPQGPSPTAPTPPPLATTTLAPTATAPATGEISPSPDATASAQPTEPPEGIGLGQPAPRIELPRLGGGTLDTAEYAGRPLWINFMATWCPPCRDELPMMEVMQEQLGEDLTIVLVDVGEDEAIVADFIESLDVTMPVGIDEDGRVQETWGAWALPVHFWLDEEGVVKAILFGGAPRSAFVESVLNVVPDAQLDDE